MVVMTTIKTHFSQQKFGEIKTSLKTSLLLIKYNRFTLCRDPQFDKRKKLKTAKQNE